MGANLISDKLRNQQHIEFTSFLFEDKSKGLSPSSLSRMKHIKCSVYLNFQCNI